MQCTACATSLRGQTKGPHHPTCASYTAAIVGQSVPPAAPRRPRRFARRRHPGRSAASAGCACPRRSPGEHANSKATPAACPGCRCARTGGPPIARRADARARAARRSATWRRRAPVDDAAAGGGDQPRVGSGGYPALGPGAERGQERLGRGILGGRKVTGDRGQISDQAAVGRTGNVLHRPVAGDIGRWSAHLSCGVGGGSSGRTSTEAYAAQRLLGVGERPIPVRVAGPRAGGPLSSCRAGATRRRS